MKPFIIGFCGKAGVGKDTAAEALAQLTFHRFAFADPLKEGLNTMFGWRPEQWQNREWKETNLPGRDYSPRRLAQLLGTDWGTKLVNQDLWVHMLEDRVTKSGVARVVIADLRFDNEARWIKSQGGLVIQLLRADIPNVQGHVSENGVSPHLIDMTILNHGSKEDFMQHVRQSVFHKMQAMSVL